MRAERLRRLRLSRVPLSQGNHRGVGKPALQVAAAVHLRERRARLQRAGRVERVLLAALQWPVVRAAEEAVALGGR